MRHWTPAPATPALLLGASRSVARADLGESAVLLNSQDEAIGTGAITGFDGGNVGVELRAEGVRPGKHEPHINASGACVGPTIASAHDDRRGLYVGGGLDSRGDGVTKAFVRKYEE